MMVPKLQSIMISLTFVLLFEMAEAQTFHRYTVKEKDVAFQVFNTTTRSLYGWHTGVSLGMNWRDRWSINYFSLQAIGKSEWDIDVFRGAEVKYFVNPKSRLAFGMAMRMGMFNKRFFSVIPETNLSLKLSKSSSIITGFAYSDGFPYLSIQMGFRIKYK